MGQWVLRRAHMCGDDHWVLNTINEPLNTTTKSNGVLYVG